MNKLREQFLLDPEIIFLNHGSFGACPRPVFDRFQSYQQEMEARPVVFLDRTFAGRMKQARGRLADFLGTDSDALVFAPNATTAMNIVARSLDLEPGDEVLSTDHEYGAMTRMWETRCADHGARLVPVTLPIPLTGCVSVLEAVKAAVTNKTKLLSISHITSPTAVRFPVEPLIDWARERGIISIIDGAHAPGQIPLTLDKLGADVYVGNCHKWMMAPKSAGFLYLHPNLRNRIRPLIVSWANNTDSQSRFVVEMEWQGTQDIAACLCVADAIDFLNANAWDDVREGCFERLRAAEQALLKITGEPSIYGEAALRPPQMASVTLPTDDGIEFKRRLYDEHRIEIPVTSLQGKWLMRLSAQGYNTAEDFEALAEAVQKIL